MKRVVSHTAAVVLTLAVLVSCSVDRSSGDLSEVTGYWRGVPPSQEAMGMELVFLIEQAGESRLEATGYWLLNGAVNNEFPVDRAVYLGDEAALALAYGGATYVATVDPKLGIARGSLSRRDHEETLLMTRVESGTLEELTPRSGMTGADYLYETPEASDDGWETASFGDVGMDGGVASEAVRGVLDGKYGFITSLLVVRDDRLVLEEYFYGSGRGQLEPTMSVTKSVVSLLVGAAIDRGLIDGVGVPILSFFPTRRAQAADGWEDVTLEHVLTMSTGVEWPVEVKQGGYVAPSDRFSGVLQRPIASKPGIRFDYVGLNVELLAGVLETATGVHADIYARDALLTPIGITEYDWSNLRWEGHPLMAGSLRLKPRDMARIGQLVLNGGLWDGKRIVSESWIERSTATQIEEAPGRGYGYLWWTGDYEMAGQTVRAVFASGLGSNYIAVLPEYDMVVVTTGRNVTNGLHQAPLDMVRDHILPAVRR
ncbi:MAG: serine hydrolase [Candidatus Eisenbacteria bacterium]|nr:serine hydrolase [Candidatus Eisenbacteria bacterium]